MESDTVVSWHDIISLFLMCDWDGDHILVIADKAVLKAENESLTDKLDKSQQQSTLKKLQDAKLQSDYEAAQAVLERIPPDIIKAYTQRGNRERKVDQYSALE